MANHSYLYILSKAIRFFKYISIVVGTLLLVLAVALVTLWYWLGSEPKSFPYFNSEFSYGSGQILKIEDVFLQRLDAGTLVLSTKVRLSNVKDNSVVLAIECVYATFKVSKLFTNFTIPAHVQVSGLKLNLDSVSSDYQSSSGFRSGFNVFESLQKIISCVHPNKLLYLDSIKVEDAVITKGKIVYQVEQRSNYNDNLYTSLTTFTEVNAKVRRKAEISVSSLNTTAQSSLEVKINSLPVQLFANFLPRQYTPPVFFSANKNLMIDGELNYTLEEAVKDNKFNVRIASKDPTNTNEIQKFLLVADNKESPDLFTLRNAELALNHNKARFSFKGWVAHKRGLVSTASDINLSLNAPSIELSTLNQIWPSDLEKDVREWIVSAFKGGVAKDSTLTLSLNGLDEPNLNKLSAHVNFQNLRLKYGEDFEEIFDAKGEADFDLRGVNIKIKDGKMRSSHVYDSSVEILYGDPSVPLIVKVLTEGQARDYTHFMGKDTLQKFRDRNISIEDIKGTLKGQVAIEIPLDKEITLENITMNITGLVQDLDAHMSDMLHLQGGNLDLKVTSTLASLIGNAKINGQPSSIEWVTALQENKLFHNRVVINSNIKPGGSLDTLIAGKLFVETGEALVNFIYSDKNNMEKIIAQLDLKDAKFSVPDLGFSQVQGSKSTFALELSKDSLESNWRSKQFSVVSGTLDAQSELELTPDFELVHLSSHITDDQTDLTINVDSSIDKMDIKVHGPNVNLSKVKLLGFSSINLHHKLVAEHKDVKQKKLPQKLFLSLQIDNALMKNNVLFSQIIGNFECYNSKCRNSGLSLTMNQDEKVKVALSNVEKLNHWTFSATNAAMFLKALDIYNEIEQGKLSVQMYWDEQPGSKSRFVGKLKIDDFYAIKTNLIYNLILASPFTILSNLLRTKTLITFETLESNFVFLPSNGTLQIDKALAVGNLLSIMADGHINVKKDQIDMHGLIIPNVLGINNFMNAFRKDKRSKGLISTPYTISGSIASPAVRVSPIQGIVQSIVLAFPRLFFDL